MLESAPYLAFSVTSVPEGSVALALIGAFLAALVFGARRGDAAFLAFVGFFAFLLVQ
ncbi:MAG: hypothetical protein AAF713_10585 [Pseudomonadota bacterium]